jgi:hypothetical protein
LNINYTDCFEIGNEGGEAVKGVTFLSKLEVKVEVLGQIFIWIDGA